MASNAPATPPASPLAGMTKLSPAVYLYQPAAPSPAPSPAPSTDDTTSATPKSGPKLVILATWMGARDAHIAKYLVQYQTLFPRTPILLLRSEPRHFIRPRGNAAEFAPAGVAVRSIFPDLGTRQPPFLSRDKQHDHAQGQDHDQGKDHPAELHIHALSNGGVTSLYTLRLALDLSTTSPRALPRYTLLLDSTPGTFRYRAAHRAFTTGVTGLARLFIVPLMHAVCASYWLVNIVLGRWLRRKPDPLGRVAGALNDGVSRQAEVRRTYVYGEGDRLVDWRDVEAHARDAEGKGFRVRMEKVEGGEHVAHVRVDPGRYWRVVGETWEGGRE